MGKCMKSQGKSCIGQLIENQPASPCPGPARASTPTPLALRASARAARDPRGGLARAFPLPPSERPYGVSEVATGAGA